MIIINDDTIYKALLIDTLNKIRAEMVDTLRHQQNSNDIEHNVGVGECIEIIDRYRKL